MFHCDVAHHNEVAHRRTSGWIIRALTVRALLSSPSNVSCLSQLQQLLSWPVTRYGFTNHFHSNVVCLSNWVSQFRPYDSKVKWKNGYTKEVMTVIDSFQRDIVCVEVLLLQKHVGLHIKEHYKPRNPSSWSEEVDIFLMTHCFLKRF